MSLSPLDNRLHQGLLGDPVIAALLGEEAELAAMIRVESALATVQMRLGIIPQEAGGALVKGLGGVTVRPEDLAGGIARDGVIAPAFLRALRAQLSMEAGGWLHWGMTSQDLTDLALVLRLREIVQIMDRRLAALIRRLSDLAKAHRDTLCLARTRMQAAAPTLFGLKAAQWMAPLIRHRERLAEVRPRLLVVQIGGAAGNLSVFGDQALAVMDGLADELALGRAEPWHKGRDRLIEFGQMLAMIAGSLGTIGGDLALLAQGEVSEVGFAGAGGSSTLPQKQNPVLAEIVQSLARYAGGEAGALLQAGLHLNERDGAAWTLEWLALPPLIATTGAALLRADEMLAALRVDADRMQANIEATRGLVLAEAASFALAAHLPRHEAMALVKKAVEATLGSDRSLLDHLAAMTEVPVDWATVARAEAMVAPARALLDRLIARAEAHLDTNLTAG
ncbi:MAG: 3-carboxy-cis,cis-muconate cycloisomerase [Methylobacterium sp.]|nr:3-carboxy-cis,cis-muconate cycloisomerase [Methylobacterium sp.]MCA3655243.1 3-carboxy-cis,cis-muconate cycloisomerase [Methylobacterium sp.]MCA3657990.1 3-carboxy-cis,cis-muconate cycloisomerase [Methylobacterium sp.]MCA3659823.1 3-carboxy-cis,cis-muconate cycloisomerase [Methylobacterium sp.]MCA3664936.1 3-carboxy-cis,cis-muconate cycloisomerase [Methylobacterium sp.]